MKKDVRILKQLFYIFMSDIMVRCNFENKHIYAFYGLIYKEDT